jgi:hypothetical protein
VTQPARETVLGWFHDVFLETGQVVELRACGVKRGKYKAHVEAGFFDHDHVEQFVKAALGLSGMAAGIYWTLNPVHPDLLARCCNRAEWGEQGSQTSDKDVLRRRWLLIDADPVRRAKISSTDAEKALAWETILAVRDFLLARGWPRPVLADSGNGYHLLFRVDLPADDSGTTMRLLNALGDRFDTPQVKLDRSVFNPSRITKLYGTLVCKGDSTPDRPYRYSAVLEVPQ